MSDYIEPKESTNLVSINAYYLDQINDVSWYLRLLKKAKRKVFLFKDFLHAIFHIRTYGLKKLSIIFLSVFSEKIIKNYEMKYEKIGQVVPFQKEGIDENIKTVIYTSIFGGYDALQEPLFVNKNCDYYAITDKEIPKDSVWKKYDTDKIEGFSEMDGYHKSKYAKFFPNVLFPDYDCSIWVDGNVKIVGDLMPLVYEMNKDHCMASFENPYHDCIYKEVNFLLSLNAVNTRQIGEQIEQYKKEGFPMHFGMREFSIIVRKHNDQELIEFMKQWWNEVNRFTMRDQISFPHVLWKNGKSIDYIYPYKGEWRKNPRFIYIEHKWRHVLKK